MTVVENEATIQKFTNEKIRDFLPYDDPFLLIDEISIDIEDKSAIAIKHVKTDEWFLKGHFKDFPIMPATLIMEGAGQAASFLIRKLISNHHNKEILAYSIDKMTMFGPVFPGEKIEIIVIIEELNDDLASIKVRAKKNKKISAIGTFGLAIIDKETFRNN